MTPRNPSKATRPRTLARIVVACAAAVGTAGVASRVNPPEPPSFAQLDAAVPRAADARIADVTLDPSHPLAALEALRRAAPPGALEFDAATPPVDAPAPPPAPPSEADDLPSAPARPPPPRPPSAVRLRDVRLGAALAVLIDHGHGTASANEFRVEPGRIVVGGPGMSAAAPVFARAYDVRDLAAALADAERGLPPAVSQLAPTPASAAGASWAAPGERIAQLIVDTVPAGVEAFTDRAAWSAHVWAGRLFVSADAQGHRAVEYLLAAMRNGTRTPAGGESR